MILNFRLVFLIGILERQSHDRKPASAHLIQVHSIQTLVTMATTGLGYPVTGVFFPFTFKLNTQFILEWAAAGYMPESMLPGVAIATVSWKFTNLMEGYWEEVGNEVREKCDIYLAKERGNMQKSQCCLPVLLFHVFKCSGYFAGRDSFLVPQAINSSLNISLCMPHGDKKSPV